VVEKANISMEKLIATPKQCQVMQGEFIVVDEAYGRKHRENDSSHGFRILDVRVDHIPCSQGAGYTDGDTCAAPRITRGM